MSSVTRGELMTIERPLPAVVITNEQMELIKTTVAKDATDAELGLFLYDCKRRGLHPLDRLLHFTKRAGKYTPVTSIDLFRSRAAETQAHMGTDDAVFVGQPGDEDFRASVTVYRLVQNEKVAFTATAWMREYKPESPNDFMWNKMPHGQLGKCAEALALRKGFPQELDGLHTFEEMDQAHGDDSKAEPKQPQRKSESGGTAKASEAKQPSVPADAKVIIGKVTSVTRPAGKKVSYIQLLGDDGRKFESSAWNDSGAQVITDAQQFEGGDHKVKLLYVERKQGNTTYFNAVGISIADAEPALPLAQDREPGAEG
jgi:phage recombination protein Bet